MTQLHRLEATNGNPYAGGVLIRYSSGHAQEIAWQSDGRLILPTLDAAKAYAAQALAGLQADNRQREIDATNWASMVAALQAILQDFNAQLLPAIRAKTEHPPALPST